MRRSVLLIPVIVLIALSCGQENRNKQMGNEVKNYSVLTLTPKTMIIHNSFPATVEGQQVIEIHPMISGYIQEIYVNEGNKVRKGQLLFKIDNPQYEQDVITAKASINSAKADVNSAKMEIEKVKPLVEKQIVSEYRLKSAKLDLEAKEAALEQANAALANAKANLAYTIIKSPQDGTIGTIPFKIGALVSSSSEALTSLSDISNVFAYFSWNEKRFLNFLSEAEGSTVDEKIENMPDAELLLANLEKYPHKGRIELASGLISTETGAATLKAVFPNPTNLLRSGSSATVQIPEILDSILVIPQSATYELQNKRFVFTVDAENKVKATDFSSVESDDGKYFLVSKGLKAGDRIVIEGVSSLKNGVKIIPKDTSALSFYQNIQ